MGYLFCAKCAQRRWDDKQTYEDEMTLLTKGPLVAENCLCDSCNAAIRRSSQEIERLVAEFRTSGLRQSEFCRMFNFVPQV
jgi:hypothetical protein